MRGSTWFVNCLALSGLALLTTAGPARGETALRVLDTWPAGDNVTLGKNQNFYLRIAYTTDEPVRIWANPYYQGSKVVAGSNPSPVHEGSGEALGWFFFMQDATNVDEIRISAGDGSTDGSRTTLTHPVRIRAGNSTAAATEPAWLVRLRSDNDQRQREDYERRMNTPVSAGDTLFMGGFMLLVLVLGIGSIAAPLWAMWRWRGAWRVAAALPMIIMGFVILRIVLDTARDPTSHNLWPFEILQAGVVSVVIIALLVLARKLTAAAG